VGVDANASGDVDDDEKRALTIKFHYISASDTPTQSYCPAAAAGAGFAISNSHRVMKKPI